MKNLLALFLLTTLGTLSAEAIATGGCPACQAAKISCETHCTICYDCYPEEPALFESEKAPKQKLPCACAACPTNQNETTGTNKNSGIVDETPENLTK